MASGGILFGAFDQTKLYWDEKDQPEDIVSRYEWNLPSIGDWLGGAQVRFCMRGDDVVFASSNFGTQRLYRYSKADGLLIGGGTPTVISAVLPYNFDALATDGTLLYALRYTFRIVEVYDLATLTLQDTLPDPGSGGSSGNGSVVVDEDGVLFLINGNAAPTNRSVYRWDGSAWHEDYAGVVLGATNSLSQYGIANGIVFQMTSPDPYLVQRVTAYYRTIAIADVTLDQVVRRLCLRTGLLTDDDIDVTDLASGVAIADGIVHAFAISQVSTTRASLEILMAGYLFECVENDKLTFVRRGGSSALTVPYADLAAGPDGQSEPLPLKRLNDIEIAARVSVKFANIQNDFQDGLVQADRLVTDSTAESIVELPIGFTPAEAAKLADANTMDNAVKLLQIGPISLPRSYSALEPTDVITLTNLDGSTFRARIMKGTIGAGVNTFELVLDDATVINSEAVTDEDYASSSLVRLLGSTQLVPMDIAPLSDALSGIGYIAAFGAEGSWPGADLDESLDNVTYAKILAVGDLAVMGTASTVLGDFTGGNVFDERNSLTVDVGEGTLSSTTRDLMLTTDVNPLAVGSNANGWEVIQFRTASYVSPGVYTLSGFLRGRRGTEWTMAGHVASERVVFLQTTGLRHVDDTFADIGVPYYLKAVTHGQSVAAAPSQLFTDTGVSQMPFAPVDLRIDAAREVTWHRRSRLASRFLAVVDPPLGEVTELYDVELRDGADVLVESDTVTDPSYALVYGGSLTGYSFTVWMKSATVGRGYPATLEF